MHDTSSSYGGHLYQNVRKIPQSENVDHPRDLEEKTDNTDSHNTVKLEQPTPFLNKTIAQLERTLRTTPQDKDPKQNTTQV